MKLWVSLHSQTLELVDDDNRSLAVYSVSTAGNGAGERKGSYRTPRGRHLIRAKIGGGAPLDTVFVGRRPTGEIWTPDLAAAHPGRDWILTRILWLSGTEPGFNRLGEVDTMRRYIYIHGSPDSVAMGRPGSIGCIRMRNRDIAELFERVPVRTTVQIDEYGVNEGDWASLGGPAGLVREAVFVREQAVPLAMEYDAADPVSRHWVAYAPDGTPVGTGRLLPDGRIGRMAVLPAWRGRGVGATLLRQLLAAARAAGHSRATLHAQQAAEGFYRRSGFIAEGAPFLEAGILHIAMACRLRS